MFCFLLSGFGTGKNGNVRTWNAGVFGLGSLGLGFGEGN